MAEKHESTLKFVMVKLTQEGMRVFRNKVGSGWVGTMVTHEEGNNYSKITLLNPTYQPFGLLAPSTNQWSGAKREKTGKPLSQTKVKKHGGTSDLIGWRPLKITFDMVGQTIAQFAAVEVKTPEYPHLDPDQKNFLGNVAAAGGLAIVARRTKDDRIIYEKIIEREPRLEDVQ